MSPPVTSQENRDICPHCGQTHREGARFCPSTGLLLQVSSARKEEHPQAITGRLPPNTLLNNRYVILRRIGQGGMAAVYQANDTWLPGKMWAIKEMSDAAILDAQERTYAVQCFRQEASLLQALDHPNLPRVIDAFTQGNKHYLVMEFVPGKTLEALYNERKKPFDEHQVLPWMVQLCDVLSYLHDQSPKIIFRDLKPSNIMLTPSGQIKLIDFGIVRFFKPGKKKDTMALGTPGFAAPEALSGQTDERSDIYSLCVTMHQLLTGYDPARTPFQIPPMRQINPHISQEMDEIVTRGIKPQRELRWASARELQVILESQTQNIAALSASQVSIAPSLGGSAEFGRVVAVPERAVKGTQVAPLPGIVPLPKTSRPTTRLLMVASQLSAQQIILLLVIFIGVLAVGTFVLSRILDQIAFDWNSVPIFAMFGALGYASYPKRGSTFVSYLLLSTVVIGSLNISLAKQGYEWYEMIIALFVSGLASEIWIFFLPKLKRARGITPGTGEETAWRLEMIWMAIMGVISTVIFYGILAILAPTLDPIIWYLAIPLSAVFASLGWFLGDFIRQFLVYRRSGKLGR